MQLYYLYCSPTFSKYSKYLKTSSSYLTLNKTVMIVTTANTKIKLGPIYSRKEKLQTKKDYFLWDEHYPYDCGGEANLQK